MTKTQTIRALKIILCGESAHAWIGIDRKKRGYNIYTSISNPQMEMNFRHNCNEITLKRTKQILENAELGKDYESQIKE